ncbi:MAG: hypothetical protein CFE29_03715 [Bradyrhizobiaceae bacterium PARB1]|jgi:hypothetical protein|nr:MAG: hypothetical protein CFE29_03715 [Bradyrhizobiaceae bacterium PARB1]
MNGPVWVEDGEKYAILGLSVKFNAALIENPAILPELSILPRAAFKMPEHWRDWLGTIRAEEVDNCDFFIVSKMRSKHPEVLDQDSQILQRRIWSFYRGLLLTSTFSPAHKPVVLTGARVEGEIGVRQVQDLDSPAPSIFKPYPELTRAGLQQAADIAAGLERLGQTAHGDSHWRLFRVIHLYAETRTQADLLHRLHQYARCVDGLIVSRPGRGASDFKGRTRLFVGDRNQDIVGEIYQDRSSVEHLNEDRLLEPFDREKRLSLTKKEAIIEHIARTALSHIILDPALWPHFANRAGLEDFWDLSFDKQREIWGPPINPLDAIKEFDPQYIHDGLLRN